MSPREALNIFDNVAAKYQGTREDHVTLQSATAVLNGLVLKAEAEKEQVVANIEEAAVKTVSAKGKKEVTED